MTELAEYVPEVDEPLGVNEPHFPTLQHQKLYRDLVAKMEAEVKVLPGMGTAIGLIIRKLARDYVTGLMADQGTTAARALERDRRMMASFKLLLDQAVRADLGHALRTEFVVGLLEEVVRILDAEVDERALRTRLKELVGGSFVTYTELVKGRIK